MGRHEDRSQSAARDALNLNIARTVTLPLEAHTPTAAESAKSGRQTYPEPQTPSP